MNAKKPPSELCQKIARAIHEKYYPSCKQADCGWHDGVGQVIADAGLADLEQVVENLRDNLRAVMRENAELKK